MVKLVHQPGVKNKEGKKHTIKSRTKATTAFALRQVRDAIVAGSVVSAVQHFTLTSAPGLDLNDVSTIPTIGLIAIGAASFVGSKFLFKGVKKHIIKKRENGKTKKLSVVADAISVAAPLTALLIGGFTPAAIVSIGVGAITLVREIVEVRKLKKEQSEKKARK